MTKAQAFHEQARSDFAVFESLQEQGREVAECHVLHYLQMAMEKLAKVVASRASISLPRRHDSFSRLAGALAARKDILRAVGYSEPENIQRFLGRALGILQQLENLNPALADQKADRAGRARDTEPNCEYPWWRTDSTGDEDWLAPALHTFPAFQTVREKQGDGATMMRLVKQLLERFDSIP